MAKQLILTSVSPPVFSPVSGMADIRILGMIYVAVQTEYVRAEAAEPAQSSFAFAAKPNFRPKKAACAEKKVHKNSHAKIRDKHGPGMAAPERHPISLNPLFVV